MNDTEPWRRIPRTIVAAAALACLVSASCLSTPAAPSYTFIEPIAPSDGSSQSSAPRLSTHTMGALRLVDVHAGDGARTALTRRDGRGGVWQDDKVRWATAPAEYVRREILAVLCGTSGAASFDRRLTIDLVHFGVLVTGSGTLAEVRLFAVVEERDGRVALAREYVATRPIADDLGRKRGDHAELCQALGAVVSELTQRVVSDALAGSGESSRAAP